MIEGQRPAAQLTTLDLSISFCKPTDKIFKQLVNLLDQANPKTITSSIDVLHLNCPQQNSHAELHKQKQQVKIYLGVSANSGLQTIINCCMFTFHVGSLNAALIKGIESFG